MISWRYFYAVTENKKIRREKREGRRGGGGKKREKRERNTESYAIFRSVIGNVLFSCGEGAISCKNANAKRAKFEDHRTYRDSENSGYYASSLAVYDTTPTLIEAMHASKELTSVPHLRLPPMAKTHIETKRNATCESQQTEPLAAFACHFACLAMITYILKSTSYVNSLVIMLND